MRRRWAALAACLVIAGVAVPSASASPDIALGLYDEAQTLFAPNPTPGFNRLAEIHAKVLRLNLYWYLVSPTRPDFIANPFDPAYDWSLYDRAIRLADARGIRVLLTIVGTPGWANGGRGSKYAPDSFQDLRDFADAASHRYSGHYPDPEEKAVLGDAALPLPLVDLWMAWNEPNNPLFLLPQSQKVNGRWVATSPEIYARICNAIWSGIHKTGNEEDIEETVACGATGPRGNNILRGKRPSIAPLGFLRGMKEAGAFFDRFAHHPYATTALDGPGDPPAGRNTITLGNIDRLIDELEILYPGKRLWITEYGYQTNPPDRTFGVSPATQAAYLRQAYSIAKRNPAIEMFLWFLLKDEAAVSRWQSGLIDVKGRKKPSFAAFKSLG